jgi:hypothetical protein
MPFPSFNSVQEFTAAAGGQIQQFVSYLFGWLSKEHKDDGSHGDITGDSLTLTGNITNTQPSPASPQLSKQFPFVIGTQNANAIIMAPNHQSRWEFAANGDLMGYLAANLAGTSFIRHRIDSIASPSLSGSGFGSGATTLGFDYGCVITTGSSATTASGILLYGRSGQDSPVGGVVAVASPGWTTGPGLGVVATTTQVTISTLDGTNFPTGKNIYVIMRGF